MTDLEQEVLEQLGMADWPEDEALAFVYDLDERAKAAWEAYEEYLLDCQNETPRPL